MKETITKETVELGLRLASVAEYLDPVGRITPQGVERIMKDHETIHRVFHECKEFRFFVQEAHSLLAHTAAAQNCELGRVVMFALLAKTFWTGWKAAQQEIIDEQVKAMEPK